MSGVAVRKAQAERSVAIIERFERLWPRCFSFGPRKRLPLKIGIDKEIVSICEPAIAKGMISATDIKAALRVYVGNVWYWRALHAPGAMRIALDGTPVEPVSAEATEHARQLWRELQRICQELQELRHDPAPDDNEGLPW
jgi:sRNA-binding protein